MPHLHGEAFAVMTYRSDDGETERIWNSRDGVTPFCVTLKSGKEAVHVDWSADIYCPDHFDHMPPGHRYFTDLDGEAAISIATDNVEQWWDHPDYPMSKRWETKEDAIKALTSDYMETPGSPMIKEKQ